MSDKGESPEKEDSGKHDAKSSDDSDKKEKSKKEKDDSEKEEDSDNDEDEDEDSEKDDKDAEDDEDDEGDKDDDEDEEDDKDDSKKKKGGSKKDSKDDKNKKPKKPPIYKRPAFIISVSIFLVVVIVGGIIFWLHARHFVSTDDAYVDGYVMQIAPQIAALVQSLAIEDNQLVRKGELMVVLDPTDYQVALEQAEAQLASSRARLGQAAAQIESSKAMVAQASAEVDAAQVSLDNATRDLRRYQSVDERARTRQQLDNAATTQKNNQAQLAQAQARKVSAEANVNTSIASAKAAEGDVRTAEAGLKRARVNLGYCRIYAPNDGRVTQRTVEAGNYVQAGQTLFMLVSPYVWVTANFKETQLTHMQPGQPVTLKVDAFPKMKLQGRVNSIQAGSGSRFSVLPAENATGNFVKIVQRVPVKILIDQGPNTNDAGLLSPGLSVEPKVRVR